MLRLPVDKISDRRTLVYEFMTKDFLQLVRQRLSLQDRRRVLKASIEAIADLHSRDIVHLGTTLPSLASSRANIQQISSLTTSWSIASTETRGFFLIVYNSPTWKTPCTYLTASASKGCWLETITGVVRRRTSRVNSASRPTCSHLALL